MIAAGTRLGVYELLGPLGSGGMGDVYRARDTRLGREVALKVLPPDLAANPAGLARFEQEARHVAGLNHPNIVSVFDVGAQDGRAYIVTELVDGATLRDASLAVRKVADVGAQIADALAAAHAVGVTHRDIKPDNVMVTRQGRVKVLDFGVAKAGGPLAADGLTLGVTGIGSLIGTVGYMAPEQVRGEPVDARTDIFAVGVLLHELLAAAPAFRGATAAEIMTATLKEDPPELSATVPDGIRHIVRRCLEKDPEERFQSARDLAFALRQLTGSGVTAIDQAAGSSEPVRAVRRTVLWGASIAAAGFAVGVLLAGLAVARWAAGQDATLDPIQLTRVAADPRNEISPAISPDGRSVAYLRVGGIQTELLVKPFESLAPVLLAVSNTALSSPVWSPDGNQVCYTDLGRNLLCVGAAGGSPRRVLQNAYWPRLAPDGTVFFIRVFEKEPWLFRGDLRGSEPQRVGASALPVDLTAVSAVSPDGAALVAAAASGRWRISLPDGARLALPSEEGMRVLSITWLPDSRHIAAVEETTKLIGSRLVVQDTRSTARRVILHTPDYIESMAASGDGARMVYSGGPVERDVVEYSAEGKLIRAVAASSILEGMPTWAPQSDGFVYRVGGPGQIDSLWAATAGGQASVLVHRLASSAVSETPVSPDGQRIAFVDPAGIHVVSMSGGRPVRVLSSPHVGPALCWSPDGEWIWYSEGPARLGRVPSSGGEPVSVEAKPAAFLDCSPDGRWLARRSSEGFVLTTTDGKQERLVASFSAYATRAYTSVQFGGQGKLLYLLGLDRRTIDVLDVESGRKQRAITFDIPAEDQIESFAFNADGSRVLLTTGGDRGDLWLVEGFARPASSWRRWFAHWESPAQPAAAR